MAARISEGHLRPQGNHSHLNRSQASFLPSRARRFAISGAQTQETVNDLEIFAYRRLDIGNCLLF